MHTQRTQRPARPHGCSFSDPLEGWIVSAGEPPDAGTDRARRIGGARGRFEVPDDIDGDDERIRRLFESS